MEDAEGGGDGDGEESEEEYVIKRIEASREGDSGDTEFYIHWEGYDNPEASSSQSPCLPDNTWELRSNLHPELVCEFEMAQQQAREAAPSPAIANAAAAAAAAILARANADLGRDAHERVEIQATRRCAG
eukprot:5784803-Prymnesium_polylepis.1